MDLGADGWQTFRYVTFPLSRPRCRRAALLAFALSFDEVIVTIFTAGAQNTLPLWIFGAIRLGQQLPEVNVVVDGRHRAHAHPGRDRRQDHGRGRITRSARNVPVTTSGGP